MSGYTVTDWRRDGDIYPEYALPVWDDRWPTSAVDGVAAMHDVEAQAGDEHELVDVFDLDRRAARQLGVHLDSTGAQEPVLD